MSRHPSPPSRTRPPAPCSMRWISACSRTRASLHASSPLQRARRGAWQTIGAKTGATLGSSSIEKSDQGAVVSTNGAVVSDQGAALCVNSEARPTKLSQNHARRRCRPTCNHVGRKRRCAHFKLCAVSGPPPINLRWNPHVGDRGHAQWEGEGVHEAHARSRHASWRPTM